MPDEASADIGNLKVAALARAGCLGLPRRGPQGKVSTGGECA
jgi:hypothetical protein